MAAHRLVMPFDISLPTGMGYYFVYPDGAEQQQKIQLFGGWIADERKGASGGAPARPETSTPRRLTHRAPSGKNCTRRQNVP